MARRTRHRAVLCLPRAVSCHCRRILRILSPTQIRATVARTSALGAAGMDPWLDIYRVPVAGRGLFASAAQPFGRVRAAGRRLWRVLPKCLAGRLAGVEPGPSWAAHAAVVGAWRLSGAAGSRRGIADANLDHSDRPHYQRGAGAGKHRAGDEMAAGKNRRDACTVRTPGSRKSRATDHLARNGISAF